MTRHLILDRVEADFDPQRDLVLGPWCFSGREQAHPDWEELDWPEPFASAAERRRATADTDALAHGLLDRLTQEFNHRHEVGYPRQFWQQVLFCWLLHLIHGLWVRYRLVFEFLDRHPTEPLQVKLSPAPARWPVSSTEEFIRLIFTDRGFRAWLLSEVVRTLAPPHWELVQLGPEETIRGQLWLRWPDSAPPPAPFPGWHRGK
ncbi:hypothetical protein WCLP8_2590002 [uncultured Gammaproteobacteria bacterium]